MEAQAIKENLKSALEEKNRLSKSKQDAERIAESTSDLLNQAYAEIAKKPELPVSLNVRKALTGNGLVVQFTNRSDKYLSVIARFENPTTRETETVRLDLTPMGTKEIGHLEGWAFSSSDVIHLQHNDYASISMAIQ
ncbi:hypothetical protein MTYP_02719 [Methylophilaceae bacterium]|nr:hypothetical protein MTYP_02719 [Methylophilaceae bacterium]